MTAVGSLCSGYTGLDMGLALALDIPVRHAWHVENDAAPSKILAHQYPGVPNYGDVKTLPYADMEPVDWLTAGYPCQPFSQAGKRLGEADARHLWPYIADTIRALRPRNVLLENVRGHVRRGLDSVLADLAELGYDAIWGVVRASDAGATHRRERIFVVAQDADGTARSERGVTAPGQAPGGWSWADAGGRGGAPAADTGSERCERRPHLEGAGRQATERGQESGDAGDSDSARPGAWSVYEPAVRRWERATGRKAPWATEPRRAGGAQRLSPRFVEWMMGLPAGWVTEVPGLTVNEQIKALGNGVVPQQAALAVRLLTATAAVEVAA